ncbi:molecular chaperone TorD family protein [Citrobacter arsenatis]|uniref:TorD/DmsD family molecular chaperone n=1 Tax=Citrobacter arsenatis TaxID=2546350 RepID=UPI00300E6891
MFNKPEIPIQSELPVSDEEVLEFSLRLLYQFYYFEPNATRLQLMIESNILDSWGTMFSLELITTKEWLLQPLHFELLKDDHLNLFVGLGMPEAAPWGSVYLHEDNLLMQSSTYELDSFLRRLGLVFKLEEYQPVDHIGLCLSALVELLHRSRITRDVSDRRAVVEFLSIHLLPWAQQFCGLLILNAKTPLYKDLGSVTHHLLIYLKEKYDVTYDERKLYWPINE